MNYIKEINAFYDHQEREPLLGSAVALWYTLMHMNNKNQLLQPMNHSSDHHLNLQMAPPSEQRTGP
ncbi:MULTISPECIES: hypothetical protein [unclassified Oceanobacillus]|uniref:hypothetical protein n=1 Tax=unclassified Oceanobacillus TaxID=2630292 RepID=UPI00300E5F34